MNEIILHIGTHKTGTTTLQRFCASASDALAERGILYPRSARPRYGPTAGHHLIPWSIRGKRGGNPYLDRLFADWLAAEGRKYFEW